MSTKYDLLLKGGEVIDPCKAFEARATWRSMTAELRLSKVRDLVNSRLRTVFPIKILPYLSSIQDTVQPSLSHCCRSGIGPIHL